MERKQFDKRLDFLLDDDHNRMDQLLKNDLISLKASYQDLFQRVIIQPLDESKIQLKLVFKEDSLNPRTFEDFYCISKSEKKYFLNMFEVYSLF